MTLMRGLLTETKNRAVEMGLPILMVLCFTAKMLETTISRGFLNLGPLFNSEIFNLKSLSFWDILDLFFQSGFFVFGLSGSFLDSAVVYFPGFTIQGCSFDAQHVKLTFKIGLRNFQNCAISD